MHVALAGIELAAVWGMTFTIDWPRFILSMALLGGLILAAAWAYDNGNKKKKP